MKVRLAAILFSIILPAQSVAADNAGELLGKALSQLVRSGYVGDTSAAERYLQAVLEQDPDHIEARWQLLYIRLVPLGNMSLSDRVTALSAISPDFDRLNKLAMKAELDGARHFMMAIYADVYGAHERALGEIDRALVVEPRSIRYLAAKGRLLTSGHGRSGKHDAEIEKGISILNQCRELLRVNPSPFLNESLFDFYVASAISNLSRPRWDEVAEHYRRFIEVSQEPVATAFALNNASIAYTKLGQCDKAKEVAEKALKIMEFGAAETNKRYAEFCLEMQKMGLATAKSDLK